MNDDNQKIVNCADDYIDLYSICGVSLGKGDKTDSNIDSSFIIAADILVISTHSLLD